MSKETEIAIAAAQEAGRALFERFRTSMEREFKDDRSLVTEGDKEADAIIRAKLQHAFHEYIVISEEEVGRAEIKDRAWIVDPVDGTSNFATGVPYFAISIAFAVSGKPQVAVVYAPAKKILYYAESGVGAFRDEKRIKVSNVARLSSARVLIDRGRKTETRAVHGKIIEQLESKTAEREGRWCAALDLCAVAEGERDVFVHRGLNAWDIAAGMLMVEEAGGKVSDLHGAKKDLFSPGIIATNGNIHNEVVAAVRAALAVAP